MVGTKRLVCSITCLLMAYQAESGNDLLGVGESNLTNFLLAIGAMSALTVMVQSSLFGGRSSEPE